MTGPGIIAREQAPVILYDTTLRDGTQREGLILSLAYKLKIARRLDAFGMRYI
jgi:2-isopropylmalate synthase